MTARIPIRRRFTSHMPSRPLVSIVIVTWNALPLLKRFLPSVTRTSYPKIELIVADNGSTDGSAEWVRGRYPSVRIIRHPENWAFCRGNNEAARHARGDYIVLLNNDVEVPPDWLNTLVDAMENDQSIGAVQPKLLQLENRSMFEYAGAAGGSIDAYGYPFARGRIFFAVEEDNGQYDTPADIFWATGAAIMLRTRALDEVGLLDENFYLHMEEIDLCWRLARSGYSIRSVPSSTIFHLGGGSLPRGDVRKVYYNFRNGYLLLYKNLPPIVFRKVARVRLALDALAAIRAILVGRPRETLAIVRAYRDALRMRALYEPPATGDHECTVLPDYSGSIVWEYYVRRRRRYSDLPPGKFRSRQS